MEQQQWTDAQVSDAQDKVSAYIAALESRAKLVEGNLNRVSELTTLLRDAEWKLVGDNFVFEDPAQSERFDSLNKLYSEELNKILDADKISLELF